jgi:hypothetical protein
MLVRGLAGVGYHSKREVLYFYEKQHIEEVQERYKHDQIDYSTKSECKSDKRKIP